MIEKIQADNIDYKADKIIAQYIAAVGLNKANIENVSFLVESKQTTFIEGQKPYILETSTVASPVENKYYARSNSKGATITSVFNGMEGWIESNDIIIGMDNDVEKVTIAAIHYFKDLKYDKQFYDTQYIGKTIFEGKTVHKISIKNKVYNDTSITYAYFDDKTGLYVLGETIKDNKTYRTKVLNYTDVGCGIILPRLATESNNKVVAITEVFRVVLNYPIENINFSKQAIQHKFDAWEEYSRGLKVSTFDYPQALIHYDNAIKANPNFIRAHEARISVLFYMEHYDEVIEACRVLKGIQPQNLEAIRMEMWAHARLEQLEQARITNERFLAKLEEERRQRENEIRLRKEALEKEKLDRIYVQEEQQRLEALKLKDALDEDAAMEREVISKEEKKAKRKRFWKKVWEGIKIATVFLDATNDVISIINNNTNYTNHNNYDRRGSYSATPKRVKTKTCTFCKGTGINPSKERPVFYDVGHISTTECNYCNDRSVHYHSECPSCQGKGEITTLL